MNAKCKEIFLIQDFAPCTTPEKLYHHIIAWGKKLPPFDPQWKIEANIVPGCQSLMYLHTELREGKLHFAACSEALISAGLAALLIYYYEGETAETFLTHPPHFLQTLGIPQSLSPSRVNGLHSLYNKMKESTL